MDKSPVKRVHVHRCEEHYAAAVAHDVALLDQQVFMPLLETPLQSRMEWRKDGSELVAVHDKVTYSEVESTSKEPFPR